jgi:cytohesin
MTWRVQRALFFTGLATLFAAALARAQDVSVNFRPTGEQKVEARSAPAKVSTEAYTALAAEDFIQIGTISASQPGKKSSEEVTSQLESAILQKAAQSGGDVVCFSKEGSLEEAEVPTGKTRRDCLQSQTTSVYSGQNCQKSCFTDSAGHTNCFNVACSPTYRMVTSCVKFSDPIPEMKKVTSLVSEGTVWRHDPKLAYLSGQGSFLKALGARDLPAIQSLLKETPDLVDTRDKYGFTPLLMAAAKGYHDEAEVLLANGADANAQDDDGMAPLHDAVVGGHKDVAALLLARGADVDARSKYGVTPLYKAAENGQKDFVELLLAKGADVNAKAANGATPLYEAAENGYKAVAELLVAKGASVKSRNESGDTPLHTAAENGRKDLAELLLAKAADPNAKDKSSQTPLHLAALGGHVDVARLLIAKGSAVNAQDEKGMTPLHIAALGDHKDMAELLLAKGAKVNAKNGLGDTALHTAVENGHQDMAEFLRQRGGHDFSSEMRSAVQGGDVGKVRTLLDEDPDLVAIRDKEGTTPLHMAAAQNHKEVAELLLARKADVNARDKDGFTPLHLAASRGLADVAELLLAKGADVNAKDNLGMTSLQYAGATNHKDVAKLLQEHGAHE